MPKARSQATRINDFYTDSMVPVVPREISIGRELRGLGAVIYGFRTFDGLIKVGYTTDIVKRLGSQGVNRRNLSQRLLFLVPGSYEDEQAIHTWLHPHRARGREYYHPTAEMIEFVNLMRANCDISPVAA